MNLVPVPSSVLGELRTRHWALSRVPRVNSTPFTEVRRLSALQVTRSNSLRALRYVDPTEGTGFKSSMASQRERFRCVCEVGRKQSLLYEVVVYSKPVKQKACRSASSEKRRRGLPTGLEKYVRFVWPPLNIRSDQEPCVPVLRYANGWFIGLCWKS